VRNIIKEHRFELELRELRGSGRDTDDVVEAVEWAFARKCPLGTQAATDPPVWFILMIDEPRLIPLCLYYTFDDDVIVLLSIHVAGESNN
jgi:hypothetical protein